MISDTAKYLRTTFDIKNIKLLDLAVGRGGDMNKWLSAGIYNVVGIDINKESVTGKQGARHRYNKLIRVLKRKNQRVPNYKFYVYDLSNPKNILYIKNDIRDQKFDIISCQFAIHYFFRDYSALDTLLTIIKQNISKNGMFIGTTLDGEKVNRMFMKGNIIQKELYYLENKTNIEDTYTPYGNKYIASLGKKEGEEHYFSKHASIEYMVDINELKERCSSYGLYFVGVVPFEKWYEKYLQMDGKYKLSDEEKEFSFLNFSFVFKNIS